MSSYRKMLEKHGSDYFRKKQQAARLSASERRYGVAGLHIPDNSVIIEHDPDVQGGFAKGAHINGVAEALNSGAFTPGTIVRYQNAKFCVVGLVKQRFVPIE